MGCVSCTVGLCNDLLTQGLLLMKVVQDSSDLLGWAECLHDVHHFVSVLLCWSSLPWLCRSVALGGISRALLNVVWTWVGGASALVMLLSNL